MEEEKIKNPGSLFDLHKKCSGIFPLYFDGFKLSVHRALSRHFEVTHTIICSSITPGNYRFGSTYVGTKQVGPNEAYPVLRGDIDCSGNLNACIYHQFGSRIGVRFDSQMQKQSFSMAQLGASYIGKTFTASATLANPDFQERSGLIVFHYLQSISPKIALGAELAYLHAPGLVQQGTKEAMVVLAGRYATDNTIWSGTIGLQNLHFCCYQRASDQVQFGIELDTNLRTQESCGTIGYQVDLPTRGIQFNASVDTNCNVGSMLEKKLCGTPFTLAFSVVLNHRTSNFRLGVGFTIA